MHNDSQGINGFAIEQYVKLDEIGFLVAGRMVVHGGIALGNGLHAVKEVVNNFCKGHFVAYDDAVGCGILQVFLDAALFLAQLHDIAHVFVGNMNIQIHKRLIQRLDFGGIRQMCRVVNFQCLVVGCDALVDDRRGRCNKAYFKFAFQPLLYDFHMEQAQKAAAEAKAQGL